MENGLALDTEKEVGNRVVVSELVDDRMKHTKSISKLKSEVLTTGKSNDDLAREKKIGTKLHMDAVKAEQRVRLLRNLTILGVGTNRIEENQLKSRKELVRETGSRVAEIKEEMERKTKDASRDASGKRWRRNSWRKEVETGGYDRSKVQKMIQKMQTEAEAVRKEIAVKNSKSLGFKTKKWEVVSKTVKEDKMFKDEPRLKEYGEIYVFNGKYREIEQNLSKAPTISFLVFSSL